MAEDRFSFGKKEYGCKALEKRAERKVCTDPQKLDEKSNDWRSVFLWLNTLLRVIGQNVLMETALQLDK